MCAIVQPLLFAVNCNVVRDASKFNGTSSVNRAQGRITPDCPNRVTHRSRSSLSIDRTVSLLRGFVQDENGQTVVGKFSVVVYITCCGCESVGLHFSRTKFVPWNFELDVLHNHTYSNGNVPDDANLIPMVESKVPRLSSIPIGSFRRRVNRSSSHTLGDRSLQRNAESHPVTQRKMLLHRIGHHEDVKGIPRDTPTTTMSCALHLWMQLRRHFFSGPQAHLHDHHPGWREKIRKHSLLPKHCLPHVLGICGCFPT